ncbi:hypothetical protein N431DRAFT_439683 [Stipitochalara longipes BDJ]|nr:hypothetical protein N431DRAFT_439683 [Stipitochalara longipes BDJ]
MPATASISNGQETDQGFRKRTLDRQSSPAHQPRQKREKYTPTACDECKKRKIKCTGDLPCRRCESNEITCIYTRSSIERSGNHGHSRRVAALEANLNMLQEQVNQLSATLKQVQGNVYTRNSAADTNVGRSVDAQGSSPATKQKPSTGRRLTEATKPHFVGHTSSAYSFHVANSTLQSMGIRADEHDSRLDSTLPSRRQSVEPPLTVEEDKPTPDALLTLNLGEIYRTLEVYREELDPIYPFINYEIIIARVPQIYEYLQRALPQTSSEKSQHDPFSIDRTDGNIIKLMVASALVLESGGQSMLGQELVDNVEAPLTNSVRKVEIGLRELQILTMTSIYYFHSDDEVLAWRTIGLAARIALEIGLHRKESLESNFPDAHAQHWALRLFWCIYVLDRRWSFGTGMPFALQDSDIDPELPQLNGSVPYLECMVAYGKLCSKVWSAVAGFGAKGIDREKDNYLDFLIQKWLQSLPPDLQLIHPRQGSAADNQPSSLQRLRVFLYLRANQIRILVHRHNVLSALSIAADLNSAHLVTDIAKDTIHILAHLRESSKIYETQPNAFNYFLVSALSAIFLAVCHAPAEFSHTCRTEFHIALSLLKGFSSKSYSSMRLWKSVRGLRHIAPKLGLSPAAEARKSPMPESGIATVGFTDVQPHVASPCLLPIAGNNTSAMWIPEDSENPGTGSVGSMSVPDMFQMSHDLTNMFEAFGNGGSQLPEAQYEFYNAGLPLQDNGEISRLFEGLL